MTFESDEDAQKAFKYLREEVKEFQVSIYFTDKFCKEKYQALKKIGINLNMKFLLI